MIRFQCFLTIPFLLLAGSSFGQVPAPAAPQSKPILLTGLTIHTVSGETVEDGSVLFVDGKFTAVGAADDIPDGTETIDWAGKHLYPGLFEAHSQIGLTEISSVAATIDHTETGLINSNAKAQVAINPDSEIIPVTRASGILFALSAPGGGLISGKSAVIQLDGWTYEDMTLLAESAMHVNWPSSGGRRRGRPTESAAPPTSQPIDELRKHFDHARRYRELRGDDTADQAFDFRLEGLQPVLDGTIPLMIRADALGDIQAAVAFAAEQKVKLVILGGYDAPHCAELLKKHDVPVVISAIYRMPRRKSDLDDHAYTLPARLHELGIRFCISSTDRSETWNTRALPQHAGTAIAFGLPADVALKAVTLYPAQILNLADRIGSIEVGKDASFIITDGDVLDTRTQVEAAYIQGRPVELSSRHTRLYEKYQQKYLQPGHIPPNVENAESTSDD